MSGFVEERIAIITTAIKLIYNTQTGGRWSELTTINDNAFSTNLTKEEKRK